MSWSSDKGVQPIVKAGGGANTIDQTGKFQVGMFSVAGDGKFALATPGKDLPLSVGVEAGFNAMEAGQRVLAQVGKLHQTLQLKMSLYNEMKQLQTTTKSLRYDINNYKSRLPEVTISHAISEDAI